MLLSRRLEQRKLSNSPKRTASKDQSKDVKASFFMPIPSSLLSHNPIVTLLLWDYEPRMLVNFTG